MFLFPGSTPSETIRLRTASFFSPYYLIFFPPTFPEAENEALGPAAVLLL